MDRPTIRITPRFAVSMYFFLCGLVFSSWASRIPVIKDAFALDDAGLGALLFLLPFGSMVALPVAGSLIGRLGSRRATALSGLSYALLLAAMSHADSLAVFSCLLFLFGFAGDMLNISMNTQGIVVQRLLGRPVLSGMHAQWSLGALAGALAGDRALSVGLSTQMHLSVVAAAASVLTVGFHAYMVFDREGRRSGASPLSRPDAALLLLGLVCLCNSMAEGAMADWGSLYYREVASEPGGAGTTGYVAFTLAMALGRLVGDRLITAMGNRRMLAVNGLLIAAGLAIAVIFQVPVAVISGFAMVGLGVSSVIPIAYSAAGGGGGSAATALATVSAIGFTGFLFGPPMIGFLADAVGLRMALLLVAALGLVISMLSMKVAPAHG